MVLPRQTANPSGDLLTASYICPPAAAKHNNPPSYSWSAVTVLPDPVSHTGNLEIFMTNGCSYTWKLHSITMACLTQRQSKGRMVESNQDNTAAVIKKNYKEGKKTLVKLIFL